MARRLAAILAADVVGYSRLMAVDETGTHARLKALRTEFIEPKVAADHGRIVKLTGDGALVEFASIVDAVQCAVEIQQAIVARHQNVPEDRRITFRIGINIGDIIVEDEDIYGDGVNVAVRLEQLADSGGICVSRSVYDQVKTKVACGFEPMGEYFVKNIPEGVFVYRALLDPNLVPGKHAPQPSSLEPAEAARQEFMQRSATAARHFADLSRQSDGLTTLLAQIRGVLAANEAITEPLWSIASSAAELVGADDEIENTRMDLQAGAISPEIASESLAAANERRAAAKARVTAGLTQLRARIGELGGD